ncbi:MAG: SDR family NAD(P)-dependent oxidoreductase [Thermoanaerobaculia bacterium]
MKSPSDGEVRATLSDSEAAVITGAGSGIGRAVARALARRGHPLILLGRRLETLEESLRESGGRGVCRAVDVRDDRALTEALVEAQKAGLVPRIVVPAAGIARVAPFSDLTGEQLRESVETNLLGALYLYRACLPALRSSGGHLFALLSVAAKQGFPNWSAYSASKWGLRGAIAALREELRGTAVRMTEIYPGATASSLWDEVPGTWDRSTMMSPEVVATALVWALDADPAANVDEIHLQPRGGNL